MRPLLIGTSALVLRLAAGCGGTHGHAGDAGGDGAVTDASSGDGSLDDGSVSGDGGPDGGPTGTPGIAFEVTAPYRAAFSGPTALVDATGDGILDVVGPNHWDDTIDVLPGDGHGGFLAAISSPAGYSPETFGIGDRDGDGDADVVVGNRNQVSDNVRWYKNDGAGHFADPTKMTAAWSAGVWILEVDGNGRADLVVDRNGTLDVYLQGPSGLAVTPVSTPLTSGVRGMQLADFSGDGKVDLGVVTTPGGVLRAGLCPGIGDGRFASCVYTNGPGAPLNPATGVAQLDSSAGVDLYADAEDDSTAVFAGGAAGFTLAAPVPAPGIRNARPFTVGATRFLVDASERFTFDVLEQTGASWVRRVRYSGSGTPIGVGDLDGDGRLDLVSNDAFAVEVALGRGDGTFRAAPASKVNNFPSAVFTADLDGDARPDVVTSSSSSGGANNVHVQLQTAPGSFTELPGMGWSGRPVGVKAIDVNGDTKLDLVAWLVDLAVWQARHGNGDGTFGAPVTITDERYTATTANLGVGTSYVHVKNGGLEVRHGTAGAWTPIPGLLWVYYHRVVDVDGDGKQDLVVSQEDTQDQPSIAYLRGRGDGTFDTPQLTSVSFLLSNWAIGDIDGDGDQDILSADDPVEAVLAQGAAAFAAPTPLTGVACSTVTLADFDLDQKLDLSCARHGGAGGIYAGTGTGTFTKVQSVGGAPAAVTIAEDLDGDGKLDLIGTGYGFTWRARNVSQSQ